MSRSFLAEITENKYLTPDILLFRVRSHEHSTHPEPGQFYMIETGRGFDPLLKRPFCLFDTEADEIAFLIRIKGKGTQMLSKRGLGEKINVVGPLGQKYPLTDKVPLVVIGGIGVASLYPLIKSFSGKAHVLYGARNKAELIYANRIDIISQRMEIVTDDGSIGSRGFVTDKLEDELGVSRDVTVYSCGPEIMLKKVVDVCIRKNVECFISLERNMACGIGSCMGCTVKTVNGYKRVCAEGPVFSAKDIQWE